MQWFWLAVFFRCFSSSGVYGDCHLSLMKWTLPHSGKHAGSFRIWLQASMCVEKLTSCLRGCWELLLACFDSLSWILISWWKKFSSIYRWRLRVMSQNIRMELLCSQKWDWSIPPDTALPKCCPTHAFSSLVIRMSRPRDSMGSDWQTMNSVFF